MDSKKAARRNRLQNFGIILLSLSALFLFFLTQAEPLQLHWPTLSSLFSSAPADTPAPDENSYLQELDWPVTVVATDAFGGRRYLAISSGDSRFTPVEGLLEEVLRAGLDRTAISYDEFARALGEESLFVDLPGEVPLCVLSARVGLASGDETPLRRLAISVQGEDAVFYFFGADAYYSCGTVFGADTLRTVLEALNGSPCSFAADQSEAYFRALDPLTVCPAALPELPSLTAAVGTLSSAELLTQFGFNAHTTNRYTESSGTEVIVESPRSLRLSPDGLVSYQGSADFVSDLFSVSSAGETPTLNEAVSAACRAVSALLGGGTQFYLAHADFSGKTRTIRFGYQMNGLPLVYSDGSAAAEVEIQGSTITRLSFHYRTYSAADTASLLLPLPQACAIAQENQGLTLALSYVDSGGSSIPVSWLMR